MRIGVLSAANPSGDITGVIVSSGAGSAPPTTTYGLTLPETLLLVLPVTHMTLGFKTVSGTSDLPVTQPEPFFKPISMLVSPPVELGQTGNV